MAAVEFSTVAVLPEEGDNVAIAVRDLAADTDIRLGDRDLVLSHPVMEGHRFVVEAIEADRPLLSWGTPFARAARDLRPGEYVCTPTTLRLLGARGVVDLPDEATAVNEPLDPYRLDEAQLRLGSQLDAVGRPRTFLGYRRHRGAAGTRNHVAIIGVTSRSGSFVNEVARRLQQGAPRFDGVVPVAHTEAGEDRRPNNAEFVLRVLAGFLVHPNVGGFVLVDEPDGALTTEDVLQYMRAHDYPDISVPHGFLTRTGAFGTDLAAAEALVRPWLPEVARQERTEQPLSDLRIALQCGGSDAFSGISANPLAGRVGGEVIRHGGSAVLAETDELIGAEGYVLENVRDAGVARAFLRTVESFKERASWHGHTAEGNPSGGNVYRGLYNIVLKSLGAARKLPRDVRLDHVISYGELLPGAGYTFMDSPGNDLESVAGQVASGCNLVFFTTGNGSITNFPFVPTLKFVTTTPRYELLHHEMDVNAGRFLDGTSMEELTEDTFELTVATASGQRSAGERAGHSQVSIWREWKQTGPRKGISISIDGRASRALDELPADERDAELDGQPLSVASGSPPPGDVQRGFSMYAAATRPSPDQLALVLPTSLCSGQIALRLAEGADDEQWHRGRVTRTVALPHTEGCGVTSGAAEHTYARTMVSYLLHPNVRMALLLEHGCEKTHNDYFRACLEEEGVDPRRFGWASIQRAGGIEAVTGQVREWFGDVSSSMGALERVDSGLGDLTVALEARGALTGSTARALAQLGSWIVHLGGTVVLSSSSALLGSEDFRQRAFGSAAQVRPTVAHGQRPKAAGWHVMRMPTTDWMETASGLGATGVQVVLVHVAGGTVSGQRLTPVVQVTADADTAATYGLDVDAVLRGGVDEQSHGLLDALVEVATGQRLPRVLEHGDVGFQITRGLLGTSM